MTVSNAMAVEVQEACLQRLLYGAHGNLYNKILEDKLQPNEQRTLKEANEIFATCDWVVRRPGYKQTGL